MHRLLIAISVIVLALTGFLLVARGGSDPVSGSVTLVGDSLNVGLEPYLTAELQGW